MQTLCRRHTAQKSRRRLFSEATLKSECVLVSVTVLSVLCIFFHTILVAHTLAVPWCCAEARPLPLPASPITVRAPSLEAKPRYQPSRALFTPTNISPCTAGNTVNSLWSCGSHHRKSHSQKDIFPVCCESYNKITGWGSIICIIRRQCVSSTGFIGFSQNRLYSQCGGWPLLTNSKLLCPLFVAPRVCQKKSAWVHIMTWNRNTDAHTHAWQRQNLFPYYAALRDSFAFFSSVFLYPRVSCCSSVCLCVVIFSVLFWPRLTCRISAAHSIYGIRWVSGNIWAFICFDMVLLH